MKRTLAALAVALLATSLFAEGPDAFSGIKRLESASDAGFPCIQFKLPPGGLAKAPLAGRVMEGAAFDAAAGLGKPLVLELTREYELYGEARKSTFTVLVYNFENQSKPGIELAAGDTIGKCLADGLKMIAVSDTLDEYLVLMSNSMPVSFMGKYCFNPSFLFAGGSLAYLDFRYVDDIRAALTAVGDDATSEGPGYVFYPSYKVRFRTQLEEYPRELAAAELQNLAGYEARMYARKGILKYCNELQVGDYRYLLVWQGNFKGYLEDEYALGKDLWILGAIVTYDVWEKVGYVFVRDFMLGTMEELLEKKLAALKGTEG